jgi:DNA-binding transcriptional regulator GbsR (MarR family)
MTEQGNGNSSSDALLNAVHDSMLDGLGQLSSYFGFSKVMGQLYGAMLLSSKPLCLDDMVERLDISKATASMNMRTLENLGMTRQVWVRGSNGKRKYFEAETDFWQIISNILKGREMRDLDRAIGVMEDNIKRLRLAMDTMNDADRSAAQLYIDRITQMRALFQFAQMIILTILSHEDEAESSPDMGKILSGNLPL